MIFKPVISKSVFRYCKVSFYPPNIDTVLFYEKHIYRYWYRCPVSRNIHWYTDTFSIFQYHYENIQKNFSSLYWNVKKVFCFVYPLKRTTAHHTMLCCFCYCLIFEWHGHACLLLLICSLKIITTYRNAISCSSHDSTSLSCQTWSVTNSFLFVFEILIII